MDASKTFSVTRIILIVLCSLLAVTLVALIAGTIYLDRMLNRINRVEPTVPTLSQEEIDKIENPEPDETTPEETFEVVEPEDVTFSTEPVEEIDSVNLVSILLIGQDRRPGEGRQRSDAMILCTINKEKKTLTMTSFLRDLYVPIPGYMDNRLNAAYALGGMPLLDQTLTTDFGVQIDGNVEVDFSEFSQIIDLMGGVDIALTSREANYMNSHNGWSLVEGLNHLDGEKALTYSRIRYLDSDFGRTNRQRNVLTALVNSSKNMSIPQMTSLLENLLPLVTTDMDNATIMGYALDLFPLLSDITIQTQHIPADTDYYGASIRGMSVLVPNLERCRQLLQNTLIGPEE